MVYVPPRRKLSVHDYHRMGEIGVLACDERVELLDGELYEMPPIGDGHIGGVNRLDFFLNRRQSTACRSRDRQRAKSHTSHGLLGAGT
jgi:hypothetical protein